MNLKEIEQIHNSRYNERIKSSTEIQERMREVLAVHLSENELENLEGIQNITSEYINVPDGAGENNNGNSTEPDNNNYNVGINNFKTKKGKPLSGGAIAGIVLACVAVLAIIVGLIIYSKSKVVQPIAVSKSYNSTDIVRITNN